MTTSPPGSRRNIALTSSAGSTSQTVFVSDLISEGPIQGLVEGPASVYLNNIRAMPLEQAAQQYYLGEFQESPNSLTFTSGTTATYTGPEIDPPNEGKKYAVLRRVSIVSDVTITPIYFSTQTYGATVEGLLLEKTDFDFSNYLSVFRDSTISIPLSITLNDGDTFEFYITNASQKGSAYGLSNTGLALPAGTYDVSASIQLPIISYATDPNTLTFEYDAGVVGGPFAFDVTSGVAYGIIGSNPSNSANFNNVSVQFRVGQRDQNPLEEINGSVGNVAYTTTLSPVGSSLKQVVENNPGFELGTDTDDPVEITLSSAFNTIIPEAQLSEIDELNILINYQALGCSIYKNSTIYSNSVFYQVQLEVDRGAGAGFEERIMLNDRLVHTAFSSSPITFELNLQLEEFKPFEDAKIIITRWSNSDTSHPGTKPDGSSRKADKHSGFSSATLGSISAVLHEKFTYPYTAYSGITFSSKDFAQFPSRTYECRGLKVKVPSNYVTREEASDGIATYNRNTSTAVIEPTPQDWDAAFRNDGSGNDLKVYTNNPAWVFYDIVTNNRYGIGEWVEDTDIDVFSLYRISKYCDELVPDGKGGLEPRFTANLYLTKAADVYKTLKDMATIFRGILYWQDSQVIPMVDSPSSPVASFSNANIENGIFNYTGTGSKARPNQVIVSWNNPDQNYELQPLLVEDNGNIIETGRVITESAVAFGCTSEGQAMRYGRWKIWTAKNQKELVTFTTALAGNYVAPGDIILVSDSNRYVKARNNDGTYQPTRWSGRISSDTTPTDILVPLDREVQVTEGYTYTLSVFIPQVSAHLAQAEATINVPTGPVEGSPFTEGDLLPYGNAVAGGLYETETEAANITDTSNNIVQTTWNEYSRVESATVNLTPPAGTPTITSSIPLVSGYTVAPKSESIWVLNAVKDDVNLEVISSGKEYRVLSVSQNDKNTYEITALEHYNDKYGDIENNFTLQIPDTVSPPEDVRATVPPPSSVIALNMQDPKQKGNEVRVQWKPPKNVNNVGSYDGLYEYLDGFEIGHNIPGYETPIRVPADVTSYDFVGAPDGAYSLGVRTLSTKGNKSIYKLTELDVQDPYDESIPRILGIAKGAYVTTLLDIDSSGDTVAFNDSLYRIRSIQEDSSQKTSTSTNSNHLSQSVSTFTDPDSGDLLNKNSLEQTLASGFLLYQPSLLDSSSGSDPYKLIGISTAFRETPYWYDLGTGNNTETTTQVALTGTVAVTTETNELTGTGTNFLAEVEQGQVLGMNVGGNDIVAKVTRVSSDTLIFLDKIIDQTEGTITAVKTGIVPNYETDCLLGRIYYDGNSRFFDNYSILDGTLASQQVGITSNIFPTIINYDSDLVQTTTFTGIRITVSSQGYENPEYRITGVGFQTVEDDADSDWVSGLGNSFIRQINDSTLNIVPETPGTLDFTVDVREGSSPDDLTLQRSQNVTVAIIVASSPGDGQVDQESITGQVYYIGETSPDDDLPPDTPLPAITPPYLGKVDILNPWEARANRLTLDNGDVWSEIVPLEYYNEGGTLDELWSCTFNILYTGDVVNNVLFSNPSKKANFLDVVRFVDLSDPRKFTEIHGSHIRTGKISAEALILNGVMLTTQSKGKDDFGNDINELIINNGGVNTTQIGDSAVSFIDSIVEPTVEGTVPGTSTTPGNRIFNKVANASGGYTTGPDNYIINEPFYFWELGESGIEAPGQLLVIANLSLTATHARQDSNQAPDDPKISARIESNVGTVESATAFTNMFYKDAYYPLTIIAKVDGIPANRRGITLRVNAKFETETGGGQTYVNAVTRSLIVIGTKR